MTQINRFAVCYGSHRVFILYKAEAVKTVINSKLVMFWPHIIEAKGKIVKLPCCKSWGMNK